MLVLFFLNEISAKIRISENNTKGKREFFFLLSSESNFDRRSKIHFFLHISNENAKKRLEKLP